MATNLARQMHRSLAPGADGHTELEASLSNTSGHREFIIGMKQRALLKTETTLPSRHNTVNYIC